MERKEKIKELGASCGTTSMCPYCEFQLEKIPKRKAKCAACKKAIYPRKDPLSGESRLYREGDLFLIEELKALSEGWWEGWYQTNKSILKARMDLAKEWGIDEINVLVSDAKWRASHKDLSNGTAKKDWDKVFSVYASMLRQVQNEKNKDKTLLANLVAGFMITGYGRSCELPLFDKIYRVSRPQYMLVDQLSTDPEGIYDLIKDTDAAKTYCHLLDVSLDTIIGRYKAEIKDDEAQFKSFEVKESTKTVLVEQSEVKKYSKPKILILIAIACIIVLLISIF